MLFAGELLVNVRSNTKRKKTRQLAQAAELHRSTGT